MSDNGLTTYYVAYNRELTTDKASACFGEAYYDADKVDQRLMLSEARCKQLEEALKPCISALRSYQYGNSATDLAKDVADHVEAITERPPAERAKL